MTTDRTRPTDFDRLASAWLADGPTELVDRVLDAALREIHSTPQRRASHAPWRFLHMPALTRATGLAAVALVAAVGVGGIYLASNGSGGPGGRTSPPPATQAPTTSPTVGATPGPSVVPSLPAVIDPTTWTPFTSAVYGFSMGYPADWEVGRKATRPWTAADGLNWSSPGVDTFTSPDGDLAVSVWGVAVDANPDPAVGMTWEAFEAWIEAYCASTGNAPCIGIHDRVVPMCPDADTECHTGAMIVPFADNVTGFKGGDRGGVDIVVDGKQITYWVIVTLWQPDSFAGLADIGGGTRLVQAFLESMGAQMPTRGPVDHSDHPVRTASPSAS